MNYTQRDIDVFNHAVNWVTGVGQEYLEQYPKARGEKVVGVQVKAVTDLTLFARAKGFKLPTDKTPRKDEVMWCLYLAAMAALIVLVWGMQ